MATTNQFELKQAIIHWEVRLLQSENLKTSDIYELKDHLILQIENLQKIGLNEEEAFWVAQKRIGSIEALNQEFGKVNLQTTNHKYLIMMLLGVIIFWNVSFMMQIIANVFSYLNITFQYFKANWADFSIRWLMLLIVFLLGRYFLRHRVNLIQKFYLLISQRPHLLVIILICSTFALTALSHFTWLWLVRLDREHFHTVSYNLYHYQGFLGIIILLVFWLLVAEYQKGSLFNFRRIFEKANFWFLLLISFAIKFLTTGGMPIMHLNNNYVGYFISFIIYAGFAYLFSFNQRYSKFLLAIILLFHSLWSSLVILSDDPDHPFIIMLFISDFVGIISGITLGELRGKFNLLRTK
jgi:hypothetical protein